MTSIRSLVSIVGLFCAVGLCAFVSYHKPKPFNYSPTNGKTVVRWYAPFLADSGFGVEASEFVEALTISKFRPDDDIHAIQFAEPAEFKPETPALKGAMSRALSRIDNKACQVVICHATPPFWTPSEFPGWDQVAPCPPPHAKLKVGRVMYETDSVPVAWLPKLMRMDQLWVPTDFAKKAFVRSGIDPTKIRILAEPFDTNEFSPTRCSPRRDHRFTFLAVFKWEKRKGWKELLQAFVEEFSDELKTEKVRLQIKTSSFHLGAHQTPQSVAEMTFPILRSIRNVVDIKTGRISRDSLIQDFYCEADVLCAPSYGEGWGRVPAEASLMTIPVIFTNYSGMAEFLNHENAFPIMVESLVPSDEDPGHKWARPSLASLKDLMRLVYSNYEDAKVKAFRARGTIETKYSLLSMGKQVWSALHQACEQQNLVNTLVKSDL